MNKPIKKSKFELLDNYGHFVKENNYNPFILTGLSIDVRKGFKDKKNFSENILLTAVVPLAFISDLALPLASLAYKGCSSIKSIAKNHS